MTSESTSKREANGTAPRDDLDALAEELSALRERLAIVDYRCAVLRLLIGADDQRHLDTASGEVETAMTAFRKAADSIVAHAASTAERFGVRPEERTLAVVAERAPEQWREQLRTNARELAKDTSRIREQLTSDVGLVSVSRRQMSATLQLLLGDEEEPVTYVPPTDSQARLIDQLA